jgi:hypothetical protein
MTKIRKIDPRVSEHDEQSVLSGLKDVNPFTTPEGYFDTLPRIILQKIHQGRPTMRPQHRHLQVTPPRLAVAAVIILLLAAAVYWLLSSERTFKMSSARTVTWDLVFDRNGRQVVDFDDAILMETLAQEMVSLIPSVPGDSLTGEDIINFLVKDYDNEDLIYDL